MTLSFYTIMGGFEVECTSGEPDLQAKSKTIDQDTVKDGITKALSPMLELHRILAIPLAAHLIIKRNIGSISNLV